MSVLTFKPKAKAKKTKTRRYDRWEDAQIKELKKLYRNTPNETLAKKFDRPTVSVTSKAFQLGLKKNKSYRSAVSSANVSHRWSD